MNTVKTYEDFVKGAEGEVAAGELPKLAVSEDLMEKVKECYEMAKNEMRKVHEDDSAMTAEKWLGEYGKCTEDYMNEIVKECESIMKGPEQPAQA